MSPDQPKKIRDRLTNNTIKAYYDLDQKMMDAHFADENDFAESTARSLLENSDLPLLIRCRAYMVLACSEDDGHLDMAKEAVRIAQLGYDRCAKPGKVETTLLADAKSTLEQSQARYDEDQMAAKNED